MRHHQPTRRNPDYQTIYRVKANVSHCQVLALDSDIGDEQSAFATFMQVRLSPGMSACCPAPSRLPLNSPAAGLCFS